MDKTTAGPVLVGAAMELRVPDGIVGLVGDVARRHPDLIACQGHGTTYTYASLMSAVDRLASWLCTTTEPGATVALYLPRSTALPVVMLACLRSGRTFLPLDPSAPSLRLAGMLEDAKPALLLIADSRQRDDLPEPLRSVPSGVLDEALDAPAPWAPPGVEYDPAATAYILFTSGSSGRPKGVAVSHLALLNRLMWGQSHFEFDTSDVVLQKTPYTFDVSLPEIFGPLIAGARTHYLAPSAHLDPAAVIEAITTADATYAHFVPTMLEQFLQHPDARTCQSLRHVGCTGEPLTPPLIRRFGRTLGAARLHNLYGPTEAAVEVTAWQAPTPLDSCQRSFVGTPVSNTALYLLDDQLCAVPAGAVGELYIAGVQVAEGYVNRPDLTDEAFVTLPDGVRGYRTGDLMRLIDGQLEYLGRRDDQVKIKGVRVEPAEAEIVLAAHPSVWGAAVLARGEGAATELVAVVANATADSADLREVPQPLASALRDHLAEHLPAVYMPTVLLGVSRLPTGSAGKTDRGRLKTLIEDHLAEERTGNRDDDSFEHIAAQWRRVAPGSRPDTDPSDIGFLDLGGSSAGAVQLTGACFAVSGRRIPLTWLLADNISLNGLRERLSADQRAADPEPASALSRIPALPEQRRLWLLEQVRGSIAAYNVVSVIDVDARLDLDRLRSAVTTVVNLHDALHTHLVANADGSLDQVVHPPVAAHIEYSEVVQHDFQRARDSAVTRLQWHDQPTTKPGPLRLAVIAQRDLPRTAVVVSVNHVFFDAQSAALFWREVASAYEGTALTSAPGRYRTAVTARADDYPAVREQRLGFWRTHLTGLSPYLRLPFELDRPATPSLRGNTARRHLDGAGVARLTGVASGLGIRLGPLLLAAYAGVLASWSGDDELVIGMPVDDRRTMVEAETIGLFITTMPVRLPTAAGRVFADLARAVQRVVDDGIRHSGVAFDDVVKHCAPAREPGRNPLFQVWFNDMSAYGTTGPRFGEGSSRILPPANPPALFDVGLYSHTDAEGGLLIDMVCGADLLDQAVPDLLAEAVMHVIEQFCANPDGTLHALLPSGHLEEPSPIQQPPAAPAGLSEAMDRFRQVVAVRHGATALTSDSTSVSYGELAAYVRKTVDLIAAVADNRGPLAVLGTRSAALAITVLAAWQAGARFVLLDARMPAAYLEQSLNTSAAENLLYCDDGYLPRLVRRSPEPVTDPDLAPLDEGDHYLATSGTTGVPRLAAVDGAVFIRALFDYAAELDLGADDRFLALAGAGHDPIFRDLVLPLFLGARTHIPPSTVDSDPRELLDAMRGADPTVLHLTPYKAGIVVAAARSAGTVLPRVRAVLSGGGPLTWELVEALRHTFPNAEILNGYGVTEVPQLAALRRHVEGARSKTSPQPLREQVPLGTGFGSRRLEVRRGDLTAAPGQIGEIHILTHTASRTQPARHRSGDLGRVGLDGEVLWAGRADRQISIAGHRAEPAEVEHALRRDELVADALVVLAETTSMDVPALRAYVVPAQAPWQVNAHQAAAIRDRLRGQLPGWLLPSSVEFVREIRLNANGKPDPAATARTTLSTSIPARPRYGPATSMVRRLRRAVADVLPGEPEIELDANFFDAGLDSFALLRLCAVLREDGFPDLDLTDLFRWPNIGQLAEALGRHRADSSAP